MVGLQRLTERLRRDCPWDREQTAATIVPHTIEEAYEVAEARRPAATTPSWSTSWATCCSRRSSWRSCASEDGAGDLAEVAAGITEKLIRRHPHVFGEREAETAGAVRRNWEQIKRDQEGRAGIFHDVPGVLPGAAVRPQGAAAGVGGRLRLGRLGRRLADLADGAARAARRRSTPRRRRGPSTSPTPTVVHETGDLLFAAVNVARLANVDPELALRAAAGRFRARVEDRRAARGGGG